MFERYTEQARRVLFFGRYEASQLGSISIGAEHLLLGLLHEAGGTASHILRRAGLDLARARTEVENAVASRHKVATSVEMPFAPECKEALGRAAVEADGLRASHIGTEHLLLALLHDTDTIAGRILATGGLTLAGARDVIAAFAKAPAVPETHVVLVQVTIRPEMQEAFEQALLHNARESVRRDAGCLRFDVSQDKDQPTRWVLHEVYDSPAAHAAHRQSPHFLAYDAVAAEAVTDKTVSKCAGRHIS